MPITLNGTTGIVTPKLDAVDLELGSKNVVERGSNANGSYVRFADGTQICTRFVTAANDGTGPVGSKIFPVAVVFYSADFVISACTKNATSGHYVLVCNPHDPGGFRTFLRGDDGTGRTVPIWPPTEAYFFITAIGRWY